MLHRMHQPMLHPMQYKVSAINQLNEKEPSASARIPSPHNGILSF